MATSKTLTPTNVTISIPEMTDSPDASVFSNCVDKEADAINTLNSKIGSFKLVETNVAGGSNITISTTNNTRLMINTIGAAQNLNSLTNIRSDGQGYISVWTLVTGANISVEAVGNNSFKITNASTVNANIFIFILSGSAS